MSPSSGIHVVPYMANRRKWLVLLSGAESIFLQTEFPDSLACFLFVEFIS